jgi:hypothetical protein
MTDKIEIDKKYVQFAVHNFPLDLRNRFVGECRKRGETVWTATIRLMERYLAEKGASK